MAELQIIGFPQSTFTRVVRMAAEEKGVPYELTAERPHSDAVNAINPTGKVPVMRHGDVELFESKAIANYIDNAFDGPALTPADPAAAADAEKWISYINTVADVTMIRKYLLSNLFPASDDGAPDRAVIDEALEEMAPQFETLDAAVADKGYLAGDTFSLADMYLMPILDYLRGMPESNALIEKAANLTAYYERNATRPSFVNTAPPQPQ